MPSTWAAEGDPLISKLRSQREQPARKTHSIQRQNRFSVAQSQPRITSAASCGPTAEAPIAPQGELPTGSPLLLTPAEAARALHVNRSTLYPLIMRGDIASILIGRARRIPVAALTQWIGEQVERQRALEGQGGRA